MNNKKLGLVLGIFTLSMVSGCSSAPWHEDLMSNNQLVGASCAELYDEQQKVADNAENASDASTGGGIGAVFLGVLEAMAASASNTPYDANNSGAMQSANLSSEHSKLASDLSQRKEIIDKLMKKKGC